jgi:hypothetical protein
MSGQSQYFRTELSVLDRLTSMLGESEDCMDSALRAMKEESAATIGTPELDQACADFQQTWSYGLQQMKSSSKELKDGLSKTSKNYHQVESALESSMRKLGGGL